MREIVSVLTRHGFGHFVTQMNLKIPLVRRIGKLSQEDLGMAPQETLALRARLALEELGPTFVKLGQILSFRPDVVGEAFVEEFTRLQDHSKPFPGIEAKKIVQKELGEDPFASFDIEPCASGSIAQVHLASLKDGTPVVVKVKRPGIDAVVASDIDLLEVLARLAEEYVPDLKPLRPTMLIEEFSRQFSRELDFTAEASNTERFRTLFDSDERVTCPRVYWKYTTRNVLTLQRIRGVNIGDREKLAEMGVDSEKLAFDLSQVFCCQYFQFGLFHADPHPGNILVDETGRIGLIDFGMTGHLTKEFKSQLGHLLVAVARRDLPLLADIAMDLGVFDEPLDIRDFRSDLLDLIDNYLEVPLNALDPSAVFGQVMRVARRNGIVLPRDFVLLGRSLMMVVETCRKLHPAFNLADAAKPYTHRFFASWIHPDRVMDHLHHMAWNLTALVKSLPSDIRLLFGQARSGTFRLRMAHEGLEGLERNIDRAGNRLSLSIVLGAMIVGSSLLCTTQAGPEVGGVSLMGLVGFALSGLLWLVVAYSFLKGSWR
jgi:ubiquinone biosynthesis protein